MRVNALNFVVNKNTNKKQNVVQSNSVANNPIENIYPSYKFYLTSFSANGKVEKNESLKQTLNVKASDIFETVPEEQVGLVLQDDDVEEKTRDYVDKNLNKEIKALRDAKTKDANFFINTFQFFKKSLISQNDKEHHHEVLKLDFHQNVDCHKIIDLASTAAAASTMVLGEGPTIGADIFVNAGIQSVMIASLASYFDTDRFGAGMYTIRELHKAGVMSVTTAKIATALAGMAAHGAAAAVAPGTGNGVASFSTRSVNAGLTFLITQGTGWGFVQARNKHISDFGSQTRESGLFCTERMFLGGVNTLGSNETFEFFSNLLSSPSDLARGLKSTYEFMHQFGLDEFASQILMSYAYHLIDFYVEENRQITPDDLVKVGKTAVLTALIFVATDKSVSDSLSLTQKKQIQELEDSIKNHHDIGEKIHELEHLAHHVMHEYKESTARKDVVMTVRSALDRLLSNKISNKKASELTEEEAKEAIETLTITDDTLMDEIKAAQDKPNTRDLMINMAGNINKLPTEKRVRGLENILNALKTLTIESENKVKDKIIENLYFIPRQDMPEAFDLLIASFDDGDIHAEDILKTKLKDRVWLLKDSGIKLVFEYQHKIDERPYGVPAPVIEDGINPAEFKQDLALERFMAEVKNLSREELEQRLRVTLFNNFGYSKDEIDEECNGSKYDLICKLFSLIS